MKIRPFTPHDWPRLVELFDRYRGFYQKPSDPAACETFLRERHSLGESVILVAEWDGEVQGFVQLYPSFTSVGLQRTWILNDLYVSELARGHRLGEALVQAAMAFVVERGQSRLSLMTGVSNTVAQGLYEKLGWKRTTEFYTYSWIKE